MQPASTPTGRRPSLSHVSGTNPLSGRRQSIGGVTPMVALSSIPSDAIENRRGSLRDLAEERKVTAKAAQDLQDRLAKYQRAIADVLREHTVEEILPCIKRDLVEIPGTVRPVEGFETLLENNIESAPVYIGSTRTVPSNEVIDEINNKNATSSSTIPLSHYMSQTSQKATPTAKAILASVLCKPSALSPTEFSPLPVNTCGKEYTGFLDVRDLVSSMIYVAVQPINEDELIYTSTGAEVPDVDPNLRLHELGLAADNPVDEIDDEINAVSNAVLQSQAEATSKDSMTSFTEEDEYEDKFVPFRPTTLAPLNENTTVEDPEELTTLPPVTTPHKDPTSVAHEDLVDAQEQQATGDKLEDDTTHESNWSSAVSRGLLNKFSTQRATPFGSSTASQITVTYLSKRNTFRPLPRRATLFEAASLFAHGLSRVPVVDDKGNCVDVISQRDMIHFIVKYLDSMPQELINVRACDVFIGTNSVKEIPEDFTALEAFVRIDEERLSGLAIVDDERRFLNATSSRDLKRFALDKGQTSLNLPVLEYLATTRHIENIRPFKTFDYDASLGDDDDDAMFEYQQRDYTGLLSGSITVSQTITVKDVITALHGADVTRAFCLDEDDIPVRVISATDLLKYACGMTNF